jgi:trimeric autotransporter adhesin
VGTGITAIGYQALRNSTGSYNTAVGKDSLFANTTGENNTAVGDAALLSNTTGELNTALV